MYNEIAIFSGTANKSLSKGICDYLKLPLGQIKISKFSDGEIFCQILENVRGKDVFIIQPTCPPVNSNLMELLIMIDAFKRASAVRITAVMPYYGYARQDRKHKPRVPISAKLVADLLSSARADRVLTMDLHAPQIQGFFDIPVDHLFAAPVFIDYIAKMKLTNLVLVSPDAGGVERARAFGKRLKASLAIMDKRREEANVSEIMHVIGDVKGKSTFIIDDMIDTAGTLVNSAEALINNGAEEVYASGSHAILSGTAVTRIQNSSLKKVLVTNTIPLSEEAIKCDKIIQLSVAELLGEAIKRIHEESSVSSLFI